MILGPYRDDLVTDVQTVGGVLTSVDWVRNGLATPRLVTGTWSSTWSDTSTLWLRFTRSIME
jgi:hypothetical protein